MADFSVSISNRINSFGPAPCTKWGVNSPYTMEWSSSKWGEGTEDLPVAFEFALITNSIGSTSEVMKGEGKVYFNEEISLSETIFEELVDGSGYKYVFIKPTTDAEERDHSQYTSDPDESTTYSSLSAGSTVWS